MAPVGKKAFLKSLKNRILSQESARQLSSADAASLLLELPKKEADFLFQKLLENSSAGSALAEMPEPLLEGFLKTLTETTLISLFSTGETDDLIYLMDFIKEKETLLEKLPLEQQIKLKKFMDYPEGTAGRIMQDDFFSLAPDNTTEEGIKKLREYSQDKFVHYIYCVNENQTLLGVLSIRELAIAASEKKIKDIINSEVIHILPSETETLATEWVAKYNFIALPVVDKNQKLLGLVTVDDVLDIVKEEATANIYAQAGLPEEDRIYSTTFSSIKNRLPWMGVNLIFALLASSIISLFEQTMGRLIILATLKNVVAGIGGNTAIQTLTVTTRGLNTGDFQFTTPLKALAKECIVGLAIGLVMGLGTAVITFFWKKSLLVSLVLFFAMLLNSLIASLAGFLLPLFLRKIRKDPAVSSGVLATIITDSCGFFVFLSFANLGLKFLGESL